jgi:hypothetical protein
MSLKDITAEIVQVFVSSFKGSPKTVRNLICTMRLVWKTAKDWGYISHDPFHGLRFPEPSKGKTYNFTVEESLAIIAAAPVEVVLLAVGRDWNEAGRTCRAEAGRR